MAKLTKTMLAAFVAAFLFNTPVMASPEGVIGKEAAKAAIGNQNPAEVIKDKAAKAVESLQKKGDNPAGNLKGSLTDKLGDKKDEAAQAATGAKDEMVEVQQETTTVQTPEGTATETTTVITPEPQAPADASAPAAK